MFPLLETLVAVYEVGQFTLAADELKVSQSTVSSRIAQLEQMVGAPLFVRNAKSDVDAHTGRADAVPDCHRHRRIMAGYA